MRIWVFSSLLHLFKLDLHRLQDFLRVLNTRAQFAFELGVLCLSCHRHFHLLLLVLVNKGINGGHVVDESVVN